MRRKRELRNEKGQAFVEFAIVLPVLLLIVLGIVQFGMLFKDYIALTDAVRVGARQAAVSRPLPDPEGTTIARVEKAAVGLNKSKMKVYVTPWDPDTNTNTWAQSGDVTVVATYPYDIDIFGLVVMSGTLRAETTERVE